MSIDIRSRLIGRMNAELARRTANLPDSIPVVVDVAPLVDVVLDEMADGRGVPLVPEYDPEVWSARRWTQPFTSEDALSGGVADIQVHVDPEDSTRVRFLSRAGSEMVAVSLPADDAEQFLVAGLAAVRAVRDVAN